MHKINVVIYYNCIYVLYVISEFEYTRPAGILTVYSRIGGRVTRLLRTRRELINYRVRKSFLSRVNSWTGEENYNFFFTLSVRLYV